MNKSLCVLVIQELCAHTDFVLLCGRHIIYHSEDVCLYFIRNQGHKEPIAQNRYQDQVEREDGRDTYLFTHDMHVNTKKRISCCSVSDQSRIIHPIKARRMYVYKITNEQY